MYLNSTTQPPNTSQEDYKWDPEESEDCLSCLPLEPSQVNTEQKAFLVLSDLWRSSLSFCYREAYSLDCLITSFRRKVKMST